MKQQPLIGQDELTLPVGYRAAGVSAGIKASGAKDVALLVSDAPAAMAGVFTTNQVPAAPVRWCRARLAERRPGRAVVANSGNANACTGAAGDQDARRMAEHAAAALGVEPHEVWVCSTGHIGDRLPLPQVESGIGAAAAALSRDGGHNAARAIMTTDLRIKHWTVQLDVDGSPVTITGLAKGAGMIEPNMATMLAFIMTDAAIEPAALQASLAMAVNRSFNRITVDGDQSTNDTVLCLANGQATAGGAWTPDQPVWVQWQAALDEVCLQLALKIVGDGEGANKKITILVEGAADDADADRAARAIANSFLVKTSWAGREANWGRLMDCLGYSGARVLADQVAIWYDAHQAVQRGVAADTLYEQLQAVIQQPTFTIRVNLNIGSGTAVVYTCEITEEYVRINVV